jgi:hypothetical protein
MRQLGFDAQHAGATLGNNSGSNPNVHKWRRQEDGRYAVYEEELRSQ